MFSTSKCRHLRNVAAIFSLVLLSLAVVLMTDGVTNSSSLVAAAGAADARASQAFSTADQLRSAWTTTSLHAAVYKYEEAASAWQADDNWLQCATALAEAAEVQFILGEYRPSLDHYEQAVTA